MQLPMQRIRIAALGILVALAGAGVARAQAKPDAKTEMNPADAALAERLGQIAQSGLMTHQIVPATLRQAVASLEAASKLNPREPRFLRLLTEAYLQLGGDEGREGAISSLTRYRELMPADLSAQSQLIDVYYTRMETAVERKKYLDGLLSAPTISPEVKSHIAVMAAKLADERAESEASKSYVDQALKLMPLNSEALRMKFRQADRDGTSLQRITILLQMLRSNPAQPAAMLELASELADSGMVDVSLAWYRNGFDLTTRLGMSAAPAQSTAYAAELLIADQLATAQSEAKKVLDADPSNVEAALLSLLVDKRSGAPEKIELSTNAARTAMLARLNRVNISLRGDAQAPATQPTTAADIDMAADVKKLLESSIPDATASYASALADLAWLEIYFNAKTADAQQYLTPLRQLVPADSVIMARLEGWGYLADGKNDEARVKLSAVADRDPLAVLGMIQLDKEKPASATDALARKLLNENASGAMGAMLIEALRSRFGLMPAGPDGVAIRAQIAAFPLEWLQFLDFSKAQNFYSLKADGLKVAYEYGEPMLARVTLTNISKYDITIGAEGAIHPDLWFDAQVKPIANQTFPGVVLDRISQKVLLHPKESVDTIVRVDQGAVAGVIQGNPNMTMALFYSVLTNPLSQQGGIAPGPGGYRAQFSHTVVRNSNPPTPPAFKAANERLQNGPADVRVRTLELFGSYAVLFKSQQDPAMQARAAELLESVRKCTSDPTPSVRAVAMYITALLSDAQVKEGLIRQMVSDSWYVQRILGLTAAQQAMEPAQLKELAKPLSENDPDPLVKQMAAAVIDVADMAPPTTAPATQESRVGLGGADIAPVGK